MIFDDLKLEEFDEFYQVILNNFPSIEIKPYDFMKQTFIDGDYRVFVLKDNNKIIGILSYFDSEEFVFADYFAIDGNNKGQGLGSKMLQRFIKNAGKQVILEVEHLLDEQSKKRVFFYQRNGFILNDQYDYFVPPVRSLKQPLYFHLMSYPRGIDKSEFNKYYPLILKLVYRINS